MYEHSYVFADVHLQKQFYTVPTVLRGCKKRTSLIVRRTRDHCRNISVENLRKVQVCQKSRAFSLFSSFIFKRCFKLVCTGICDIRCKFVFDFWANFVVHCFSTCIITWNSKLYVEKSSYTVLFYYKKIICPLFDSQCCNFKCLNDKIQT